MAIRYSLDRQWPAAVRKLYEYIDQRVHAELAETKAVNSEDSVAADEKATTEEDDGKRYVLLHELAKHIRDPVTLRFEILNVFIPSRDTISSLFGNMLWALSRHPEIWTELRKCAQSANLDRRRSTERGSAISLTKLAALRPFQHVVLETLRAIGPSGRQFRVAQRDTVLPRGGGPNGTAPAFVPRGTIVCTVAHCVHHDPAVWGPDADQFRPSRWADEEAGRTPARPPWTFVPFLGGPHACPAQQQVMAQAMYVLWRMVLVFPSIECRDDVLEYIERQHMVIESRRGVQIALPLPS